MKLFLGVFLALAIGVMGLPSQGLTAIIETTAVLDGPSEPPTPNPNYPSPGTGFAMVTFDTVARTLDIQANFSGLLGNTTAAHVHAPTAVPGAGTAGVATQTPSFSGFPLGVTSGTYQHTFDTSLTSTWNSAYINANGGTVEGAEAAFAVALVSKRAYFNIHSTEFPGGEIRGFLVTPVPATMLLFGTGLAVMAGIRMRRKK